ncbi:hypothetical protein [Roseicella frigidaeris]|uniref:Uncharacterized protein n=1 Tax=Roseicella frigidaeris TaxID=2230885 RepID=A0A327M504_9PROT|nr:hypothetical protein [Roseicella frigidaeris]RAI57485.1 hypothetical protein DOO78_19080 [Roseicella frigidaeris]
MAQSRRRAGLAQHAAWLCLPLLAACAGFAPQQPPLGWASLPSDAVAGAGDPVRAAVINTAFVFNNPGSVAGRPAEAARAVANYAFLTSEIPFGPRWVGWNPTAGVQLQSAYPEVQAAFGIAPNAPTQQVVNGLFAASRALQAGDVAAAERALSPPVFTAGGAATLQRLSAMPSLPNAGFAATLAQQEMDRSDRLGSPRGGGPGGGGGGRF